MPTKQVNGFIALLKERGLKATSHRIELLSLLSKKGKPLGAYDIKALWKKGSIDTVTIYRVLESLAEAKIVRRVNLQHGHTDYELANEGHHHHLVCTDCGLIEDLKGCVSPYMDASVLGKAKKFASLDEHALEFFGTCKTCAA